MGFKLNKTQMEKEAEKVLLEPGEYQFKIIAAEEKPNQSSSDGKMLALALVIRTPEGQVEKVKDWLGQWKNGPAKVLSFLDSIGVDSDSEWSAKSLINKTGVVAIKHGEYNNKPTLNVDYYVPVNSDDDEFTEGDERQPVSDDDIPF